MTQGMRRLIFLMTLGACTVCAGPKPSADIGAQYLGAAYMTDPLGEERAPDTDPQIRDDAFDCVTFVETAMADGNADVLRRIRYRDGVVDFMRRNHFIETDWMTNNAARVENVSARYAPTARRTVTIDKAAWMKKVHNLDADTPPVTTDVEYIPYENLGTIDNAAPLIVLFVVDDKTMAERIGTDIAVVHVGFLMPGGKTLRHASSAVGRVVDTDFAQYVARRRAMSDTKNIGIALVNIK